MAKRTLRLSQGFAQVPIRSVGRSMLGGLPPEMPEPRSNGSLLSRFLEQPSQQTSSLASAYGGVPMQEDQARQLQARKDFFDNRTLIAPGRMANLRPGGDLAVGFRSGLKPSEKSARQRFVQGEATQQNRLDQEQQRAQQQQNVLAAQERIARGKGAEAAQIRAQSLLKGKIIDAANKLDLANLDSTQKVLDRQSLDAFRNAELQMRQTVAQINQQGKSTPQQQAQLADLEGAYDEVASIIEGYTYMKNDQTIGEAGYKSELKPILDKFMKSALKRLGTAQKRIGEQSVGGQPDSQQDAVNADLNQDGVSTASETAAVAAAQKTMFTLEGMSPEQKARYANDPRVTWAKAILDQVRVIAKKDAQTIIGGR